jgi:AcrR family transcriptional regulator
MSTPQSARRTELRTREDPQVAATRGRLLLAFRAAADEEVRPLSVSWICARSGVGRSTFYTHFATVDALAVHAITREFDSLGDQDRSQRAASGHDRRAITLANLGLLVDALERARAETAYAIGIGSRDAVAAGIAAEIARTTRATIATERPDLDDESLDLASVYVGAGTANALLGHLGNGGRDRDRLIALIADLLPPFLSGTES